MAGIRLILVTPHLRANVTSVSRFVSIAEQAIRKGHDVLILNFVYPFKIQRGLGVIENKSIKFSDEIEQCIIALKPELNILQKITFFLNDRFSFPFWKVTNLIYQMLFKADVFKITDTKLLSSLQKKISLDRKNIIVGFGGPFSVLENAFAIRQAIQGSLLVLDYRDLINFGYPPLQSNLFIHTLKKKHTKRREFDLLQNADLITTVSVTLKGLLPGQYHSKIKVFENGADFDSAKVRPQRATHFTVLYLGTLYKEQLIDETFFEALSSFCADKFDTVRILFIGAGRNERLNYLLDKHYLNDISIITGRLEKDELISYLNNASVFLHLKYGDRNEIITSKNADYCLFRKPILLPDSDKGDLEDFLLKYDLGYICYSKAEIRDTLSLLYREYMEGKDYGGKSAYGMTRESIAEKFVAELEQLS